MNATLSDLPAAGEDCQRQQRRIQHALDVQNACNISGVAHSLAELCRELHGDGVAIRQLPDAPEVRLFVAKLADLCGLLCSYPLEDERQLQAALHTLLPQADASDHSRA